MGGVASSTKTINLLPTGADECSPRDERYFKPTLQIAWIIDCSVPLKDEDPDKPEWLDSARDLFKNKLGFPQVYESVNKSVSQLYHDYKKMQARLTIARDYGEQTFLMVYYRGEAGLDRRCLDTYAVVRSTDYFALEHYLRDLA